MNQSLGTLTIALGGSTSGETLVLSLLAVVSAIIGNNTNDHKDEGQNGKEES